MNRFDFSQTGGFPLDQSVMAALQDNTILAARSAALGGSNYILSGMIEAGTNVGNGFIVIAGEILPFVGGVKQDKIIVVQEAITIAYEDEVGRQAKFNRYATFGDDGVTTLLYASLPRNTSDGLLSRVAALEAVLSPITSGNGVMIWNRPANEIPAGWEAVEDFEGVFPVGAKSGDTDFAYGVSGGSRESKLSSNHLPRHFHYSMVDQSANTNSFPGQVGRTISAIRTMIREWVKNGGSGGESYVGYGAAGTFPGTQPTISPTSYAGEADPSPIKYLNPYRTVHFIRWKGLN